MGNEFKGLASHSAEYFGDTRDHWWHDEFLRSLADSWRIDEVRDVLDVGCGVGHWGRLLARVLPQKARLSGVDRDPVWVEKAADKAAAVGLKDRFSYRLGDAQALAFDDSSFDLVTCQTVLIHLPRPDEALREMVRVARPRGLVVVAEPTNLCTLTQSIAIGDAPDVTASILEFHLVCLKGKRALGEGDDLIGERLPGLFAQAGLRDVELRMNSRVAPMLPPYASAMGRALADELVDMAERGLWVWGHDQTRRYFLGGGGAETEFASLWDTALAQGRHVADAVRAEEFACAGGSLFYVAWGRKAS
jgi:SAM-dependent methyltransferase